MIARAFALAGGLLFALSFGQFLWFYLVGLDRRPAAGDVPAALTFNAALFTLFALHHSVFARTPLRAWVARHVPPRLERSVYVWTASLGFLAVCLLWRAAGEPLWHADGAARMTLRALQLTGIAVTLWATHTLDELAVAGIRQLDAAPPARLGRGATALSDTGLYGLVRHPIYLGWLLIVWPAPTMTPSHLTFAAISTAYLVVATFFEERSLHATFGAAYAEYARKVRRKMIPGVY